LNTLKQVAAPDTLNAFRSVAEVIQANLPAGAKAENAEGKVVLYRTPCCGFCKQAAAYMLQKNVPFVERDIANNAAYKAEYKSLGGTGAVPLLVFGDQAIYGFEGAKFDKNYADFQARLAAAPHGGGTGARGAGDISLEAGQTFVGKIAGISVYTQPNKAAEKLTTLGKTDEVIYMGEEREGLYRVTTQKGEGWVDKLLVKKL